MVPTAPIALTFFEGSETDCIPIGPPTEVTWEELRLFLADLATEAPGKKKGSAGYVTGCGFFPATPELLAELDARRAAKDFPPHSDANRARILQHGYRTKELVSQVWTIVADYDDRPTAPPDWRPESWPCAATAYSSHNWHPEERPGKWRVFLQLAEPIPAAHYDHVKAALQPLLPEGAILRWAGQPAFLPTCPSDRAVQLVDVPGAALDWRALIASVPAPAPRPPAECVLASATQDTSQDARVVQLLSSVWNTTGHRAFGALGGIMYRMGISQERAEWIADGINAAAADPHPDPEGRIEEAYNEAHDMGVPTLIEALKAINYDPARAGHIRVIYSEVERLLLESVRPPPPAPSASALALAGPEETDEDRLLTWNCHLQRNNKGEIKNLTFNTLYTLDTHPYWRGLFGLDEFSRNVVFMRDCQAVDLPAKKGDVFNEDRHPIQMQAWFGRNAHEPSVNAMIAAVHTIASQHVVHVVRNYLGKLLGTWDGKDRNLCNYLGAEATPYQLTVCRKWMISAVARAMRPGEQADSMLILEGDQGRRKSSALRSLCPDVRWFYEAADRNVGGKDFMQDMTGKWLCEIPEVDQLIRSRDGSELKGLLTRTVDTYRPSYGRKSLPFPRQLVFAGTTNETEYLRDATGNRRFWSVQCGVTGPILTGAICDDRDQLWAQAVAEYDAGMSRRAAGEDFPIWWLGEEEKLVADDVAAERQEIDPWSAFVEDWARQQTEPFTALEALASIPGAKPLSEITPREIDRMGKTLRVIGMTRRRSERDGVRSRRWSWR